MGARGRRPLPRPARRDDFEEHFADALRWHDRLPAPFERARTELCLGERLRRARRRADVRPPLRRALAVIDRLGATPVGGAGPARARRER